MTAPGAGTPAATAPGRAAYEAFEGHYEELTGDAPASWEVESDDNRAAWEAAAQAAIDWWHADRGLEPPREITGERDSLTGRVAELVSEGNELRGERDKARNALGMLARIVHANVLVMEAAAIEMRKGDNHAAMQWILNAMPDQWDGQPGTEWDGKETAQEWFDRQPAVQDEHPGLAVGPPTEPEAYKAHVKTLLEPVRDEMERLRSHLSGSPDGGGGRDAT